jgi:hypothetical protein
MGETHDLTVEQNPSFVDKATPGFDDIVAANSFQ